MLTANNDKNSNNGNVPQVTYKLLHTSNMSSVTEELNSSALTTLNAI